MLEPEAPLSPAELFAAGTQIGQVAGIVGGATGFVEHSSVSLGPGTLVMYSTVNLGGRGVRVPVFRAAPRDRVVLSLQFLHDEVVQQVAWTEFLGRAHLGCRDFVAAAQASEEYVRLATEARWGGQESVSHTEYLAVNQPRLVIAGHHNIAVVKCHEDRFTASCGEFSLGQRVSRISHVSFGDFQTVYTYARRFCG